MSSTPNKPSSEAVLIPPQQGTDDFTASGELSSLVSPLPLADSPEAPSDLDTSATAPATLPAGAIMGTDAEGKPVMMIKKTVKYRVTKSEAAAIRKRQELERASAAAPAVTRAPVATVSSPKSPASEVSDPTPASSAGDTVPPLRSTVTVSLASAAPGSAVTTPAAVTGSALDPDASVDFLAFPSLQPSPQGGASHLGVSPPAGATPSGVTPSGVTPSGVTPTAGSLSPSPSSSQVSASTGVSTAPALQRSPPTVSIAPLAAAAAAAPAPASASSLASITPGAAGARETASAAGAADVFVSPLAACGKLSFSTAAYALPSSAADQTALAAAAAATAAARAAASGGSRSSYSELDAALSPLDTLLRALFTGDTATVAAVLDSGATATAYPPVPPRAPSPPSPTAAAAEAAVAAPDATTAAAAAPAGVLAHHHRRADAGYQQRLAAYTQAQVQYAAAAAAFAAANAPPLRTLPEYSWQTLFFSACRLARKLPTARLAVRRGAAANARDPRSGASALAVSAQFGPKAAARMLLTEARADPRVGNDVFNAYQLACVGGNVAFLADGAALGDEASTGKPSAVVGAGCAGDIDNDEVALEAIAPVQDENAASPTQSAAAAGWAAAVTAFKAHPRVSWLWESDLGEALEAAVVVIKAAFLSSPDAAAIAAAVASSPAAVLRADAGEDATAATAADVLASWHETASDAFDPLAMSVWYHLVGMRAQRLRTPAAPKTDAGALAEFEAAATKTEVAAVDIGVTPAVLTPSHAAAAAAGAEASTPAYGLIFKPPYGGLLSLALHMGLHETLMTLLRTFCSSSASDADKSDPALAHLSGRLSLNGDPDAAVLLLTALAASPTAEDGVSVSASGGLLGSTVAWGAQQRLWQASGVLTQAAAAAEFPQQGAVLSALLAAGAAVESDDTAPAAAGSPEAAVQRARRARRGDVIPARFVERAVLSRATVFDPVARAASAFRTAACVHTVSSSHGSGTEADGSEETDFCLLATLGHALALVGCSTSLVAFSASALGAPVVAAAAAAAADTAPQPQSATPLLAACALGSVSSLLPLLQAGADPWRRDPHTGANALAALLAGPFGAEAATTPAVDAATKRPWWFALPVPGARCSRDAAAFPPSLRAPAALDASAGRSAEQYAWRRAHVCAVLGSGSKCPCHRVVRPSRSSDTPSAAVDGAAAAPVSVAGFLIAVARAHQWVRYHSNRFVSPALHRAAKDGYPLAPDAVLAAHAPSAGSKAEAWALVASGVSAGAQVANESARPPAPQLGAAAAASLLRGDCAGPLVEACSIAASGALSSVCADGLGLSAFEWATGMEMDCCGVDAKEERAWAAVGAAISEMEQVSLESVVSASLC